MAHLTQQNFVSLNIAVLTISDTRTYDTDTSGDTLVDRLQTAGHMLIDRGIVMDDIYQIAPGFHSGSPTPRCKWC